MKHLRFLTPTLLLIFVPGLLCGQDATYLTPPQIIADMLLAKPTPNVSIDDKGEWMLLTKSEGYPPVEELARPELRIAGLRIDPNNFSPSRQRYITAVDLQNIATGRKYTISGLPDPLAASNFSWGPDERKIAFLNTTRGQVDLYVIDIDILNATKINSTPLNIITGGYSWFDNETLLYRGVVMAANEAPQKPFAPKGPTIQENNGKASPRPTFQDLIKSPYDEELFAFYATTQLIRNTNGVETQIGEPAIYSVVSISPDKNYLFIRKLQKPYSYLVPYGGFPSKLIITDQNGQLVKHLFDLPSTETAPSGNDNMQNVPRSFDWRDDEAATLVWCHPVDSGLIRKESEFRDAVYALRAPFTTEQVELFKTKMRYRYTMWGNDQLALVTEGLTGKYLTQTNQWNPSTGELQILMTRNTTDAYSNPGFPFTVPNQYNRDVLWTSADGKSLLYNNTSGSSPQGDLPFLLSYDLELRKADTLWKCKEGGFEMVTKIIDPKQLTIVTRKESKTDVPNYWLKNLKLKIADRQLTTFENPYPQLDGVTKEKIRYKRADGVDLTGELYLPAAYDARRDGPLPILLWAYPREFQSAADAAQIRGSEHRFTMLNWGSPVFYVTQGYAILNNAEMPIVATSEDKKPNDDFVDQLKMNAKAAIDKLAEIGVGDSNRVAVGGHSYGAFMTANLLAHTDYFKGGIARSGAYNRTLTPFGFQNEDRTYWEAPDVYHEMSPFSNADKIKTPLLLIHGDSDNNTGTFPLQSERMFNAIKGHGGTVKYISLPYESHGYQGKENLLHMLAEQLEWMEKYVKGGEVSEKKGRS
ncbi:MAG TPA: prolyl oligopeptidase family serine peptidase [Saprospiraceae bacterium]|nr:prolyl oligopeptidase family serine peptidase [Saprospiraceae bacterium]